jgi:hypothetical protein
VTARARREPAVPDAVRTHRGPRLQVPSGSRWALLEVVPRYPLPVLIKARLKGHDFDLFTLAELFREGDPAVASDAEGHYLSFAAPNGLFDDGSRLYEAVSLLLHRVNGVARACMSDFRPVGLVGRFDDETGRQAAVVLAETAEARARAFPAAVMVDGQQPPMTSPPGPGYVQLAAVHPDVAEVLEILGKADLAPNWADLFKVFEIVNNNVTGLRKRGWITSEEIRAFTASANRPDISGADARHARMSGDPPKRTMTLIEARQMIGALVTGWLDSLSSSSSSMG